MGLLSHDHFFHPICKHCDSEGSRASLCVGVPISPRDTPMSTAWVESWFYRESTLVVDPLLSLLNILVCRVQRQTTTSSRDTPSCRVKTARAKGVIILLHDHFRIYCLTKTERTISHSKQTLVCRCFSVVHWTKRLRQELCMKMEENFWE